MSTSTSKKRGLNPEVKVLGTGGSIGSLESTQGRTLESTRKQCLSCLNLYYTDRVLKPIEIVKEKDIIVIPQNLWVVFKRENYDSEEKIIEYIDKYHKKIIKIYNRYKKEGRNECKCDRVGYKLKLSFSLISSIRCWVIVEISGSNILYRLCYGGRKIDCLNY
jgi:hypothetical protein